MLMGTPPLPLPCVLHPFYQPGMGSRYLNGGAKVLGLGPEHLGSNPALPPAISVTSGKFFNLSFLLKKRSSRYLPVVFEN